MGSILDEKEINVRRLSRKKVKRNFRSKEILLLKLCKGTNYGNVTIRIYSINYYIWKRLVQNRTCSSYLSTTNDGNVTDEIECVQADFKDANYDDNVMLTLNMFNTDDDRKITDKIEKYD